MDMARGTQRPEVYPGRSLEHQLTIVGGGRRRTLRGSRLARHREPATEPATPARSTNLSRARVLRAFRGFGRGKQGRKRSAQKEALRVSSAPAQLRRPRAARSNKRVNTLKNKGVEKSNLLSARSGTQPGGRSGGGCLRHPGSAGELGPTTPLR